jgi:predicted membrane channel-forming protein YqfA (hemolysin III family)
LVRRALNECISTHSLRTRTHWCVIDHITNSILSTCSRTWVDTFVSNTSLIARTIIAYDTFWSTACVRIALVFR